MRMRIGLKCAKTQCAAHVLLLSFSRHASQSHFAILMGIENSCTSGIVHVRSLGHPGVESANIASAVFCRSLPTIRCRLSVAGRTLPVALGRKTILPISLDRKIPTNHAPARHQDSSGFFFSFFCFSHPHHVLSTSTIFRHQECHCSLCASLSVPLPGTRACH